MFSVMLLITKINQINLNKLSTSHFTKISLHDFTDLHMKLAFYGGKKEHRWKGDGMERNNRFYHDYCIFINVGGLNEN